MLHRMFLVVLSLFMFFGFKNALLVSTAIPLSMLIGFMVLGLMNADVELRRPLALVLALASWWMTPSS